MSTKHTPGPWFIQDDHGKRWIECGANDDTVCEIHRRNLSVSSMRDVEFDANARLIAAAPGLLEALQNILEACEGYVPNTSKQIWAQAYLAIAKATGEQA